MTAHELVTARVRVCDRLTDGDMVRVWWSRRRAAWVAQTEELRLYTTHMALTGVAFNRDMAAEREAQRRASPMLTAWATGWYMAGGIPCDMTHEVLPVRYDSMDGKGFLCGGDPLLHASEAWFAADGKCYVRVH